MTGIQPCLHTFLQWYYHTDHVSSFAALLSVVSLSTYTVILHANSIRHTIFYVAVVCAVIVYVTIIFVVCNVVHSVIARNLVVYSTIVRVTITCAAVV